LFTRLQRIKSEQLQNQLREETKQLQVQIKLAGERFAFATQGLDRLTQHYSHPVSLASSRYEQQKELLKREEMKAKMIEEQMIKANEQISSFTNMIEAHKRAARDAAQQLVEFKAKLVPNALATLKRPALTALFACRTKRLPLSPTTRRSWTNRATRLKEERTRSPA
jgi:hypothetical protein